MERVSLAEAAQRLGITVDATRKRIKRGLLAAGKDERDRWFVTLPSADEREQVDKPSMRVSSRTEEDLRAEVSFLRERLMEAEHERAELRRMLNLEQQNVARLLPATASAPDAPHDRVDDHEAFRATDTPSTAPGGAGDAERPADRPQRWPWWMRIFGGR